MAKIFLNGKWKKRTVTALTLALSATFALGVLTACKTTTNDDEDEDETTSSVTDTQVIKNGNFEFYAEKETEELDERRQLINTPTSWSFTSGSPLSNTRSGIIDVEDTVWDYMTKAGVTFTSKDDAKNRWEDDDVTAYDRLKFYDDEDIDSKEDFSYYGDYTYSADFEDVEKLREELGDGNGKVLLHDDEAQRENGDTNVLMIHNTRDSDGVLGTGQYYTSSSSVTLQAGTAAEVSVWVKTSNLYQYYKDNPVEVTSGAGAYIGVTQTVGGKTLDQMQIKNINTANVVNDNGWKQYTIYLRANAYATSTFTIVLGLGQGSTDNRYEHVNGYALFDDITYKTITNEVYVQNTLGFAANGNQSCDLLSKKNDKLFDVSGVSAAYDEFALDLSTAVVETPVDLTGTTFGLTEEVSGSKTYTSQDVDARLALNTNGGEYDNLTARMDKTGIAGSANKYLAPIVANDFANYPSSFTNDEIILLLSANGAALTATLPEFTVNAESNLLLSFYVKTSEIINGRTGASATLIDGETKTAISAFDTTTLETVDIDDDVKDIYDGWTRCSFIVRNETLNAKTFQIQLHYGTTSLASATLSSFGQGWAAFTNFTTCELNATLTGYVAGSTGDRVKDVTLTASIEDSTKFDTVSAVSQAALEAGDLGKAVNFTGVLAGSKNIVENGTANTIPDDVYVGLLNKKYVDVTKVATGWQNNLGKAANGGTAPAANEWWNVLFGNKGTASPVATQPLVIYNDGAAATASYGLWSKDATISASTYQKISMRVKVSAGATATIYLMDKDTNAALSTNLPTVNYWYDDDGNICVKDPSADDFDAKTDIAFYLEDNGLYKSVDENDTKWYANLHNYEEKDGNLKTSNGMDVFFGNDGKFYAYREKNSAGEYEYDVEVTNLPTDIARSASNISRASVISVTDTQGKWVEVSFYVHTGNKAKDYRVEVWAGTRDNATDGIPAGGYVFFDNYVNATTSNYDTLLDEAVSALKDKNSLGAEDNLDSAVATYYTFTFYDSIDYVRYDATTDEEGLGNPYGSYTQSSNSEKLVYLTYDDMSGDVGFPMKSVFIDYSATDYTPTADDLGEDDTDDTDDTTTTAGTNIWLVLASASLAFVTLFAVGAVFIRKWLKKHPKKVKAVNKGAQRTPVEKDEE